MKLLKIFLLLLVSTSVYPQTASEIIRKSEDLIKGKTAHGTFEMIIATPDYTRTLKMESWWVGNEKALIVIKYPNREAGNKTLKIGNEMWNYLKNTETTIKIPPSMMLQSWNGSDFTNDDLVRESNLAKDYYQKLIGEDELNGVKCWKIELIPKPDAPVVWGKLYYWVRKDDYLPAKVEYYDEKGKLVRYIEYKEIKKFGKRNIPSVWVMHNVAKKGHSTTIKIIDMEFDININNRIFTFRELERGD
ncbi:outer membrane lipoprotein-sorting protein [Melioribacter sp. Ez-97]|uniref:outer membrane lipoprotein-sorting protein n=1 Tax=unclassified Melioribacter TaxID=2627329 RepID=UPI003BEA2AB7